MTDLLPGASAENAAKLLAGAAREGRNVLGKSLSGVDLLNEYRTWANEYARLLSLSLTRPSLDDLLLTRGYERLMQLDPAAYGNNVATVVLVEFEAALSALEAAAKSVEIRRQDWVSWRYNSVGAPLNVVVLDTNVLLRRGGRLCDLDWSTGLELLPDPPIALAVPLVVIEELDKLKSNTGKMDVDGDERTVKELARAALRFLDETFEPDNSRVRLRERTIDQTRLPELWIGLLIDDLDHTRLSQNDAEIIDHTLALRPYVGRIAIATGDRSMRFRARHAGVSAFDPLFLQVSQPPAGDRNQLS